MARWADRGDRVGIGEAGCTPPAHSLRADYYGINERSRGLAVFAPGTPVGASLGILVGGIVNSFLGWRAAFLTVGLPGLLMALVTWLAVRKPRRLGIAAASAPATAPFGTVMRTLLATRTYVHVCVEVTLFCISGYSVSVWGASFQIRSFGVTTGVLGPAMALTAAELR